MTRPEGTSSGPVEELAVESLSTLLLDSPDINAFLTECTEMLCRILSRNGIQTWCTIILLRKRRPMSVTSTEPQGRILDALQYPPAQGPCLEAARTGRMVYIPDTGGSCPWPDYARALAERGVGALLAVPLDLGGEAKATFNAYAEQPRAFDGSIQQVVQDQIALAAPALRLAVRMTYYRETEEHLNEALRSRTTIDLAVGIIMGQSRCSQDEAFRILTSAASNRNIKLRDLAAHLVAKVSHGPVTTHFDR